MIKYIPMEEYKLLWEDCRSRMRFTSPNLDPIMKTITAIGLSGEGTEFVNEYDRLLHKHLNPDLPIEIQHYEKDGLVIYRPRK